MHSVARLELTFTSSVWSCPLYDTTATGRALTFQACKQKNSTDFLNTTMVLQKSSSDRITNCPMLHQLAAGTLLTGI